MILNIGGCMILNLKKNIMTKRVVTKIGDLFSVKIDENNKKYFQLIAFDLSQLNSDVIRAFEKIYPIDTKLDLLEIVNGNVEFYAHCMTKAGIKMNLWEKIGSSKEIGDTTQILFRDTNDYGCKAGEEPIKISDKWHVWHINDEKFTFVEKLLGSNLKAEIGIVVHPFDIIERIKTGKYSFSYPGFE